MATKNLFKIILSSCYQLHQCQSGHSIWYSIVELDCTLYGKGPQQNIITSTLTLFQKHINNKCASHEHYCFDSVLCLGILMFCTNRTKTLQFSFFLTILPDHIRSEESIITMLVIDFCGSLLLWLFFKIYLLHSLS